ncbi:hypothetical protein L596_011181 [Steinernema carpocapsae]|uniref:Hexosyltransferase n=1 Tax=Steinernema carpocapsae TaxID=34508 RepID=A0A4U5NSX7_STECR|nr:hypothetical protein L596_011181 [Steinernema carpocapsae]
MKPASLRGKFLKALKRLWLPLSILLLFFLVLTRCYWKTLLQNALDTTLKFSGLWYTPLKFHANFSDVQYGYLLLSEPAVDRCCNKTLFVFIPSRPSSFNQRQAIRLTWAHPDRTTHASFFFIVGNPEDDNVSKILEAESRTHGDLIINDIVDSYRNLSLKIYAGLDWYNRFCSEVPFALKIDDDSVLNVDRLVYFANREFEQQSNKTLFGITWKGTAVVRNKNSTWYVSRETYKPRIYPTYCNGPAYMMTSEAAKAIVEKAAEFPFLHVEDAFYTGILANAADVRRVDKKGIFWWKDVIRATSCDSNGVPRLATMYSYPTPEALYKAYFRLQRVKCIADKQ